MLRDRDDADFSEPVTFPSDYDLDVPTWTGEPGYDPTAPHCYLDGIPTECGQALRLISQGMANVDPTRTNWSSAGRLGLQPNWQFHEAGTAYPRTLTKNEYDENGKLTGRKGEVRLVIANTAHWELTGYTVIGVGLGWGGQVRASHNITSILPACDVFVAYLSEIAQKTAEQIKGDSEHWVHYKRESGEGLIGSATAWHSEAPYDWNSLKPELTQGNQNHQAFSHILAHAGAMIVGNVRLSSHTMAMIAAAEGGAWLKRKMTGSPFGGSRTGGVIPYTGEQLSNLALEQDQRERKFFNTGLNADQGDAEIAGDHAGRWIGGWMSQVISGRMSSMEFESRTRRALLRES
ncbi:MAG: hypothetical protein U0Z53_05100 [Blastocatellia bacterium]